MKRHILLAIVWIGVCFSVVGQISRNVIVNQSDLRITRVGEFDKISLDNVFHTDVVGHPELPVYIQSFVIPIDAQLNGVTVNSINRQKLPGTYNIHPVQAPIPISSQDNILDAGLPNPVIYNSITPYPGRQVEIISDELYLGYRIVTVRLYPVEYIPLTRELYLCDFDFTINYSVSTRQRGSRDFLTQTQSLYRYELNKRAVRFLVENPEAVDNYDTKVRKIVQGRTVVYDFSEDSSEAGLRSQTVSVIDEQVPEYIIITNNDLKPHFQTLADWKTKKGIFTIIVTTEEINADHLGSDLQEKIRNYLKDAYSRWGTGLFVLLGGNTNIIPARMVEGEPNNSLRPLKPSDLYYATVQGTWNANNNHIFGENVDQVDFQYAFFLGRAPVKDSTEAQIFTNKILKYERAQGISNTSYYNNLLIANAFILRCPDLNYRSVVAHDSLKRYTTVHLPTRTNPWLMFDNHNCLGTLYNYGGGIVCCRDGTSGVPCPGGICTSGDEELSRNNFLSALNTGGNSGLNYFHIVYHMDHSGPSGMGTSGKDKGEGINKTDMDNLSNGSYFQILISGGCGPATFIYDCVGARYLLNPNGGGVAFIGNADLGYASEHTQFRDFLKTIYSDTLGRHDIGFAFQKATANSNSYRRRLTLLGDPTIQVWTNIPQTFNVTVPTAVQAGAGVLTVTVSGLSLPIGETALICVQKGTEVYETKMIYGNGVYIFPIDIETTGIINVTATAHNYFPVEKTVQVNASTAPNPVIQSVNFVDDGTNGSIGNGNGRNDAGETIYLQVELKNTGINTANNLTAILTSTSSYITVLSDSASVGSIASGNTALGQFLYEINKDAPEILANAMNPVQFKLEIQDGSNAVWTRTFNIDVFATDLKQRNKIIVTPPSGTFGANTNVTFNIELQNMEQAPTNGLTAVLTSNNASNIVSSCSSTARSYPSIGKFETKTSATPFQFTTGTAYTTGTSLNFTLTTTDIYGKTNSFVFNLTKPANINGLDFMGGERNITLTWNTLAGAGGYNIYRCDTESGNYVKLNAAPVSFSFFNDASDLNTLTKYYYKVTAVSSSGMEGDAVPFLAWTSYPTKEPFPITMEVGATRADCSVQLVDIDNDGKKEIFTAISSRTAPAYLVALRHDGTELFDIDNNITTYSGFAKFTESGDYPIEATPAIGDLYADGEYQIVSLTRKEGGVPNLISCHSFKPSVSNPNRPELLWQKTNGNHIYMRGAVLANIDNSSDGSLEIITIDDVCNVIRIFDNKGTLLPQQFVSPCDYLFNTVAVADLDGDGDMEIIAGGLGGVYIWHHDGTPFTQNPFFTRSGYRFDSSPVVCDLDGDGQKEILIAAKKLNNAESTIFAIKLNGALVPGWTTGSQTIQNYGTSTFSHDISVGDLNGDGKLDVVCLGNGRLKAWDYLGQEILNVFNTDFLSTSQWIGGYNTPILADVDGDGECEIIFAQHNSKKIHAIKLDGTEVLGFPLSMERVMSGGSVAVADIDGNGKNEIIAVSSDKIYVWETNGNPNRIEWGSERNNPQNTGEYRKKCPKTIIRSNTVWNSTMEVCDHIIVESGTLTLSSTCTLTMKESSMIIVRSGANLVIDGATISGANIKALPQSSITLKNNAYVKLRKKGEFNILLGATFDYLQGSIDITP